MAGAKMEKFVPWSVENLPDGRLHSIDKVVHV